MSNLIFPEGIKYEYRYIVGGDYFPTNASPTTLSNLYRNADSNIIDIQFDTSNITSVAHAFSNSRIKDIKYFDTSNVTDMSNMFNSCSNLTTIPQFDTSNVTSMMYMFDSCSSLTSIPQLDTSKVTNMSNMFSSCSKLASLSLLDCSSVTNMGYFFGYYGTITNLKYLGGFKDLGKQTSVSGLNTSYFLRTLPNITYESIMNVINNLYDRASAGMSTLTLYVHANTLALLSDADKALATNKGWILS